MLANLGLSAGAERVYRAMLDHPESGVDELTQLLGCSERELRDGLDALAELSLVRATRQGIRATRPQAGLMTLLARAEAEVVARQQQIEATRATIAALAASYEDRDDREQILRLEGLDAVRERLTELAHLARSECLSFSTGGAQPTHAIAAEKPLNQLAIERGVSIRNVYQDSFRNDPATLEYARWMAGIGGLSRTVPTLPMRLVIVDREIALVPIDPDNSAAGAMELRGPGIVLGLCALFERVWESGTPFGDMPTRDDNNLLPQERELLRLLAEGHTDESAARRLAVSVRSVQRLMTAITERLDASSRFQAGVTAARRGWV
ncbi:LuxR C-terminal-related transcriptional regulator [Micromonospora azadirachtae]|uniref:LuxR C-terminal-related transcriptional regulator n=1 Tax=Micromonospora azadirachtae TaxID=1970735 RepID=A0ABW2ZZJ6_9ACTN